MLLNRRALTRGVSAISSVEGLRVFLFVLLSYVLLFMVVRRQSSRDPTSKFFDPVTAYDPVYSAIRLEQGASFINAANNTTELQIKRGPRQPQFCLGIATIARKGVRYFKDTVGTFLEGLSEEERADIHLILFIAHTDPSQHPAFAEPWLHKLADQVLLYNASEVDIGHIRSLETNEAKIAAREKALFDYTYLLEACAAVDTPYVIMLEDDLVALDGWYHRTAAALSSVEEQTRELGAANCESSNSSFSFFFAYGITYQGYTYVFFTRKNYSAGTQKNGLTTFFTPFLSPVSSPAFSLSSKNSFLIPTLCQIRRFSFWAVYPHPY
jgi:hypothetical protein